MPERTATGFDSTAPEIKVPEPIVMSRAGSLQDLPSYDMSKPSSNSTSNSSTTPSTIVMASQRPSRFSGNVVVPPRPSSSPAQRRKSNDDASPPPGGILSAPLLAWVQKNRETRRRLQLQQEAEEQIRKIAHAEGMTRHHHHHHHHQNHHPYPTSSSNTIGSMESADNDSTDENFRIGTQHLSKSGEGMTAELDLGSSDDDDDDEYMIPPVRIHPESHSVQAAALESDDGAPDSSPPRGGNQEFKTPDYILTPEQMHHIAKHVLPKTIAYCQWRRLYSLNRDGDSFDGCLRIISHAARTLLVVRTTKGAVFGGYADSPWRPMELARFYGSAQACLFSVKEKEEEPSGVPMVHQVEHKNPKSAGGLLNVYRWSGKNRYIQVCDTSTKMLAFGGGGSDGAFGLCIQEDFQTGSTGPCDTFDNAPLCDESTFKVVDVEIWEFLTGVF